MPLASFVRAYIDSGLDRTHPMFANRLVDGRRHFGPLNIELPPSAKQQFFDLLAGNAIDVRLHYSPETVRRMLDRAATPVAGTDASSAGAGFVSRTSILDFLGRFRFSDLVDVFSKPGETRVQAWKDKISAAADPLVFQDDELGRFGQYCQDYDLIFFLRLSGQRR